MAEKVEDKSRKGINANDLKKALRIFQYIKPFRLLFSVGFFFLLITMAASLAFPKLLGNLMSATPANLGDRVALLAGVLVLQAVAGFFRILIFVNVTEKSLANIRQDVYAHLIRLPMSFFSEKRVGELNSRIASDTAQIQETLTSTLAEFLRQISMVVGGIIILAITSVKLTLFIIAVIPTMMVLALVFGRYIRKYSKQVQAEVAESNTIVEETLQAIQTVKAFANEFFEIVRYRKKTDEVAKTAIKGGLYRGAFASFIILGIFGSIVAVIWFAVGMIHSGELAQESLSEFILYAVFIGGSIGGLANVYTNIQKAIGATEDLFSILDTDAEPVEAKEVATLPGFKGAISFKNVAFAYPSREDVQVLNGIDLHIASGEQVALVGSSGAGKSTMVSLVLRFFDPTGGEILFDDKSAKAYDLHALRNQMAVVPQDVVLFGGTIRENIAYGKPRATDDEIEEAARKANAHDFIIGFPDGYQTEVGERGIQLSGGQRQRIAIARAVLKNPKILVLDEATSSLDSESEKLVQDALDKLMKGRTSIVIAHRLSTVRNADRILVMEKGQIIESGPHKELVAREKGVYKKLSELQLMSR
jgi:ABC-type multidrug transport system fused ATPase/permease subunit